jgi:hypothetical protein
MKQALHIFGKDVRLYWIEILATLTVTALFVSIYPGAGAVHQQPMCGLGYRERLPGWSL